MRAEIASKAGENLESTWLGTLMYGPLAMTATDVTNWKEATLNIDSHLSTIAVAKPSVYDGSEGNLYTLIHGTRHFQPDYYRHSNTTHYFRINEISDPTSELKIALSRKLKEIETFSKKNYTKKSFKSLEILKKSGERMIGDSAVSAAQISSLIDDMTIAVENLKSTKLNKEALKSVLEQAESYKAELYTQSSFE